ncbi:hypothetical protein RMATCC62417_16713 [Rhizopus microsporus]|nr:hypothetical protein RMATCC62417_16713 [Rhizopus microsporus]
MPIDAHFGNRSTNRVEGAHAAIKAALGKISSGKISTMTAKIDHFDHWYSAMRERRKRQAPVEMLDKQARLYNKDTEYRFREIEFKVTRFAMGRICKEIAYGKTKTGGSRNSECRSCSCVVNYKIPCYHILAQYDIIPLNITNRRWWIDYG